MKRVRRVTLLVLVFLIIGAVVNVGVAWVCVARADIRSGRQEMFEPRWPMPVPRRWPEAEFARRTAGAGWHIDRIISPSPRISHVRSRYSIIIVRSGWPMASLQWERWFESAVHHVQEQGRWRTVEEPVQDDHPASIWRLGLAFGSRPAIDLEQRLPLMPLWPGFAINTIAYTLLAACIWYGPSAVRRSRRRSRGACPACGYSRAGLPEGALCPECGSGGVWNAKFAKRAKSAQSDVEER